MKSSQILAIGSIISLMVAHAAADWDGLQQDFAAAKHQCKIDYMRNHCWPHPFLEHDAMRTRNPFAIMTNNGWRLHHTLSNDSFRAGDDVLTVAGRNRIQWIATQAPENRRYVFVLQGQTSEETERRVHSVREMLAATNIPGVPPRIMLTHRVPSLASGEWNRRLTQARNDNMLVPQLMEATGGAGGGGGQ